MFKRIVSLAVLCALAVSMLAGCAKKTVSYKDHLGDYVKTMDYHDGFTILQLTDIHWHGGTQIGDEDYGSEGYLRKVINEAVAHAGKIDLIEITGDTFLMANRRAVNSFIDFMTRTEIPYAIIWGNHDRQSTYNPNWISKRFLKAKYSLYTEVDNDDVHERSNYVINLLNPDGSTAWQITNLDSGASYRDGAADFNLTYDYLRDDQFEWMTAEHDAVGKDVPVICYYHIAQADYDIAWDAIQAGASGYKQKFFNIEGFAPSKYAPVTEDICLKNNVKAVFIGHDHADDWTFTTPSGVTFGMGVKSGKELYYANVPLGIAGTGVEYGEEFELIGASLITLNNTSGDFSLEHLYLNERDEGDFVMWVEY
ncbi:MAG: metallophosphoesterase [Lachnospiraceae bacterium]|nr:metallophosphoesterase [Lachnospiraceae bacterium]